MKANNLTDSHQDTKSAHLFPLKYCGHQRLENVKAMKRIMEIDENITTYFSFLKENKKFPSKDNRFTGVKQYLFIHERMYSLMFSLMERFVRHEMLQANSTTRKLMKIDLTDESNLLPITSVGIGFGTKNI